MRFRAAACAVVLGVTAEVLALPPPRHFPLEPGNRWTYVEETYGWKTVITVLALEGDAYRVDLGGRQVRIGGPPDAPDIELPGEGFVPYYRFLEDSFIHRDPFECDDRVRVTAASRDEEVQTPAGTFGGCLRLDFGEREGGNCADAGTFTEWWKPEVGLVRWTESWIGGVRSYVLDAFERLGPRVPFLRGDSDGSFSVELTDAVHTLNFLFLGGPRLPCEDAADSNDDGRIGVDDPIQILNRLFLRADPLPPPGDERCGIDPSSDALGPCTTHC